MARGMNMPSRARRRNVRISRRSSGMTRGGFLRTTGMAAAGVGAAAMGIGGVAHAAGSSKHIVTFTPESFNFADLEDAFYNPPAGTTDVYIRFKPGTYYLPDYGQDRIVLGEPFEDPAKLPNVNVHFVGVGKSGSNPETLPRIVSEVPDNGIFMLFNPGYAVTFKKLEIESSGWDGIFNIGTNGFSVDHCVLKCNTQTNLTATGFPEEWFGLGDGSTLKGEFSVTNCHMVSNGTFIPEIPDYDINRWGFVGIFPVIREVPPTIEKLVVKNNVFESNTVPESIGYAVHGVVTLDSMDPSPNTIMEISNNVSDGPSNLALLMHPHGNLKIENNDCILRDYLPDFGMYYQAGIEIFEFNESQGSLVPGSHIRNNNIKFEPTPDPDAVNKSAIGIRLGTEAFGASGGIDNLLVENNVILSPPSYPLTAGLVIEGDSTNNTLRNNTIHATIENGPTNAAIALGPDSENTIPFENVVQGNKVIGSGPVGIRIDADDNNIIRNNLCKFTATELLIENLGTGNVIVEKSCGK